MQCATAHAQLACSVPAAAPTPAACFADGAIAALLSGGGQLVSGHRPMPTEYLRYAAERRSTGSVVVTVVESPWATERQVLEAEEQRLRRLGYRARAFAGCSKLLIAASRGSR